ncbi:late transcription factor VLTF-1 [Fowlpox virus]|uniref:Late transcription factor 1 n=9 Tax=Fowlpox virus TaxID=10261 RepID=VLTF1_FOWPN|nr:late transcription factor VLTF-1 [Fowlpox virus]P15908.1 RecName: Full=Late transcription factor 1; Short=VLTF-1 [Fowlpox virus strain NVSL]UNS14342.1 ALPV-178 [Albatrosspox virus]WPD90833.1 late transcription factor VLTF-1 [Avipoxvirus sp.]CAE52665.1 late transcription factor, G8R/VLTF-1 orthologue [Fowlpox virus isolate HP-438/Munich]AAF44470.1 ORF FPV126 Late transcription factor VLTF-1 [Fowlpox virus]ART91559.1 late transcription factor [Fowlpox virus]
MSLRIKIDKLRQLVTYFSEFSEEVSINIDVKSNVLYIFATLGGSINIWTIVPLNSNVFYNGVENTVFNLPVLKVKNCLCSFHNDAVVSITADHDNNTVTLSSHYTVSIDCNNEQIPHSTGTSISLGIDQKKSYIFNFHKYEEKCCGRTVFHLDMLLGFIKCISQYQYLNICFDDKKLLLKTPGTRDTFVRSYSMTEWSPTLQNYSFKIAIFSLNKLRGFKKRVLVFESKIVMDTEGNILGLLFRDRIGTYKVNVFMAFQD